MSDTLATKGSQGSPRRFPPTAMAFRMLARARVPAANVARRNLSSDVAVVESGAKYVDKGQGKVSTMVFNNRPAWICPSRDHWLINGCEKLGSATSTGIVLGLVSAAAFSIIQVNDTKYAANTPSTCNAKWAKATAERKLGKRPIYWETKATPADDDDDDDE